MAATHPPQAHRNCRSRRRVLFIAEFPMPEEITELDLNAILHELYDRTGYDLAINYSDQEPTAKSRR